MPQEAKLLGLNGREDFVVLVDGNGKAAVVAFTHLLQYGIEDATMEAVKSWKFEPGMKDGHAVTVRIPMFIECKPQSRNSPGKTTTPNPDVLLGPRCVTLSKSAN